MLALLSSRIQEEEEMLVLESNMAHLLHRTRTGCGDNFPPQKLAGYVPTKLDDTAAIAVVVSSCNSPTSSEVLQSAMRL